MKTETINYATVIPYKVIETVSLIIENGKLDFYEALEYFYNSKLYSYLSDETTKLWHLSAEKLFNMLEENKNSNNFEFPDFV